ncbi:MAG: hypothetical protein E7617_05510 [Ruminococcaceae bacterium]|nr:hypothetical protein [Oscillospiraceae bacterium]
MFGYVKPVQAELLVKEYEFYKATYCGVCRSMKRITGALSNLLHSYDSVFLALIRMLYIPDSEISAGRGRCVAHPMKPKAMLNTNSATDYTARAFAILTYHKLKDDIKDERMLRRMATGMLRPIYSSAGKRADLSRLSEIAEEKLGAITALEESKHIGVDEPAGLFGELLGAVFSFGLEGADARITYQCGYHLGKFIYAADAAEDYEKDRVSGSYNPYVLMYDGRLLSDENKSTIKCALLLECRELESAVNLLPFGKRATIENIIKNIIYLGLPKRIEFLDKKEGGTEERQNNE